MQKGGCLENTNMFISIIFKVPKVIKEFTLSKIDS